MYLKVLENDKKLFIYSHPIFYSPKNSPNEFEDLIHLQRENNVSKSYASITYRHIAQDIESSVINMESCGFNNRITKGKLQSRNEEF